MVMSNQEPYIIPPELLDCQPSPGWALVKPDEKTDMTTGGLLIAGADGQQVASALRTGRVVAMGKPRTLEFGGTDELRCEVGNTVFYSSDGSALVHLEGTEHHLVKHPAILAQVKVATKKWVTPTPSTPLHIAGPGALDNIPSPIRSN